MRKFKNMKVLLFILSLFSSSLLFGEYSGLDDLWDLSSHGISTGDSVEYIVVSDDLQKNLYGSVGVDVGAGTVVGEGAMTLLDPYYQLRYYLNNNFSLDLNHHIFHVNLMGDLSAKASDFFVTPGDLDLKSYLKSGFTWNFLVDQSEKKHKLILDAKSGGLDTIIYYYIDDVVWKENREFGLRGGYIHRLGEISFVDLEIKIPENSGDLYDIYTNGNTYYHGAYLGLSITDRQYMEVLYRVSNGVVQRDTVENYIHYYLDFHYFPYAELVTGSDLITIGNSLGGEIGVNIEMPIGEKLGFAVDIATGVGPFVSAKQGFNFVDDLGFLNNIYFTMGIGLSFSTGGKI